MNNHENDQEHEETTLETVERYAMFFSIVLGLTINSTLNCGLIGAAVLCGTFYGITYLVFKLIKWIKSRKGL